MVRHSEASIGYDPVIVHGLRIEATCGVLLNSVPRLQEPWRTCLEVTDNESNQI